MTTEKKKEYLKKYYKTHKESYAYSKRLNYWRKQYFKLLGVEAHKFYNEKDLRIFCHNIKSSIKEVNK